MADKYENFDDAFADMTLWYNAVKTNYQGAVSDAGFVIDNCPEPPTAAFVIILAGALLKLGYAFRVFSDCLEDAWDQSHCYESIYHASNEPEAGALTWDALLNLMLTATPENIQYFIGLVDAYRISIWNAPFNYEFYAALARGFQQWP